MKIFILSVALLAVILGLLTLLGLSNRDAGMWMLNSAVRFTQTVDSKHNIQYGDQAWQTLDVYSQEIPAPVIIFVNGGSWRHGHPNQYRFVANAFANKGYTVVLPNYIKYPNEAARYPQFVKDIAAATAWVKQNISQYNGRANELFLVGHSAGAHTIIMLSVDGQFLNEVGLSERDIRGVVGLAGPYSFIPDWYVTKTVFGPPDRYPLMDALNYVDGVEPDTLLIHSTADVQVGQYNQERLAASLSNAGSHVETILYDNLSHIDMVTSLHPWLQKGTDITSDIDGFIQRRIN